ncbi:MAG: hypothetical protein ACFFE8_03700 [Candidatus Heimdallarchaeota archaeon]
MVITPICAFDARTGILCKKCKLKLRKKKITSLDVEVSKAFGLADQKYPKLLQNVTLSRAHQIDEDDTIVLLIRNGANIQNNKDIKAFLEDQINSQIEIVELGSGQRSAFAHFFAPLEILEIDQLFVPPDGDIELKITLKGDPTNLRFPIEQSEQIASLISKSPVRLEIEA